MIKLEKPVTWKPGAADEVWKVMVCARDAARAQNLISEVAYILDNPGACTLAQSADVLRRFSGEQIADALLSYHRRALQSVENALPTPQGKE